MCEKIIMLLFASTHSYYEIYLLMVFVCSFAYGVNVCRKECNDGGCLYADSGGNYKCDCLEGRTGSECEMYEDACKSPEIECQNGGKCVSTLGLAHCDCLPGYHGFDCILSHNDSDSNYPKRPSLYYRTKVRPGELIMTRLVVDYSDAFEDYTIEMRNDAIGFILGNYDKESMSADDFHRFCKNDMSSGEFPINTKMCDFVKTYGDSKITVLMPNSYFMSKTQVKRNDIYFKGDKNEGRMGGKYLMRIIMVGKNGEQLLDYYFYHLVVDDESSNCLPFINPGENCKTRNIKSVNPPLKVKRKEDVPIIKMIVTQDDKDVCTKVEYEYEWKVYDAALPLHYADKWEGDDSLKIINLNDTTLNSLDLALRKSTLPEGKITLRLKLSIKKQANNPKEYASNYYTCYLDVSVDSLHAEILGSSLRQVSDFDLETLDASPSNNPNELQNDQNYMDYIWTCDVKADAKNCQEYKTSDPIRKLEAPLNKAKKYVFTLITRVNNYYMDHIGRPKEGTATVTLLPNSIISSISIKCKKNCGRFSSPLEIIYLEVDAKSNNGYFFEWSYSEHSEPMLVSAKSVRELNTPHHVCILSKRSLGYDKLYTFKAKDKNSELESSILIRTAAEPIAGKCHVNPTSGIAGTTLFTITCSKFQDVYGDNDLFYYYYERYENDQDGLGLLIDRADRGSDCSNNIILSTGRLAVLAFNSFGINARVDVMVQIFESNTNQLVKYFKIMKSEFLNGNISVAVQMLSVICDSLLSSKKKDGFSPLFDAITRIPSKGSIFRIEQSVTALKNVVNVCSEVNGHKITAADALAISNNLLLKTRDLFEYLKTVQNDEAIAAIERIERIYKCLKSILDILIGEVDPVIYKDDSANSMRYHWSSLENMALATRNVEETLKVFGESIVLHQMIYEKNKMYDSAESRFWANMLNADMLKEENNIINYNLAKELLLRKETTWGLQVFEMNEKLAFWTDQKRHSDVVKSNVKYVALSAHDLHTGKYIGLIDKFVSPASITFNVTETVDELDAEYTIRVPAAGSERIEFDKAIKVFRLDMTENGAIFLTIKPSSHSLLVAWTSNIRPDFELMRDEKYVTKIPADSFKQFTFQTHKEQQNDIHYIGIFADTEAINSPSNNSYEVKFNMNTVCMRCLYWKNIAWSSDGMEIGQNSFVGGNVHCLTYHFSMFSSSIYVPPNLLNPIDDIHLFLTITNNMVCLILVAIIFIIYIVLLYWSNFQDKKDIIMSRIIILNDNYMCENEVYLVTVYTGHGIRSGTTAHVCIELNGTVRNSRVHWLHSPDYRTLQRSNDDWFLIFTPQSLGELQSIRIWHDNYGADPDWYCQRVIITELRRDKTWTFDVERWFSLRGNIEHLIYTAAIKHEWKKDTKEYVGSGIREKHLWASVFIRHPRSPITRCQRLSVILCAVLSIMLASMMFYGTLLGDEEEFGRYELRLRMFTIALQSVIVEMILTFSVHQCFKRGRTIQLNKTTNKTPQQNMQIEDDISRSCLKKTFDLIIDFMAGQNVYYPVDTVTIPERRQWNIWFIIGWTYCVTVYILTTFFIVLYGLKFGRIKSLCWLTSITIGIVNGVIVSSPSKIILISVVVALYSSRKTKDQNLTYSYNLTLNRYRIKTSMWLLNVEYTRWIRKIRRRRYYVPLTSKAVDILRDRRKRKADRNSLIMDVVICAILILTSLCCLYNCNVFDMQNERYRASRIVSEYFDRVLFDSNDQRAMTVDGLKELISEELLKTLHSLELYNGMPITDDTTAETIKYDKRGWFGLYNGRLIGGGIRLRQRRVKTNGEIDKGKYGPGWTECIEEDDITTPWTYFKNSNADDTLAGYELHLIGGLAESKSTIDEYLRSQWLDVNTRSLYVQFQIYTPDADLVIAVEIRMTTDSGLLYTISSDTVRAAVPTSSVVIASWVPYAFTVAAAGALMASCVACLLICAFRPPGRHRWTAMAYDVLLAALAAIAAASLRSRLAAMEQATAELSAAAVAGGYYDLTPVCRAHAKCVSCAAALVAAALLRIALIPVWPDVGRESRGRQPSTAAASFARQPFNAMRPTVRT